MPKHSSPGVRWAVDRDVKSIGKLQQERTPPGAGDRQRAGPGLRWLRVPCAGGGERGGGIFSLIPDSCSSVWNLSLASSPVSLSQMLAGGCLSL